MPPWSFASRIPTLLGALLQIWLRMGKRLREARIAHGDLQHANVLLVPGRTEHSLAAKLILEAESATFHSGLGGS
jgi:hypothetical protein